MTALTVATWRDHLGSSLDAWAIRGGAHVLSASGVLALALACLGVYGVKSYVVARRTREFGIRLPVGAQPRALLWQVIRDGGGVSAVGATIGLLLAALAGQALQGLLYGVLYGVGGVEPVVLILAELTLLAASLVASALPALRATRINPTAALRSE